MIVSDMMTKTVVSVGLGDSLQKARSLFKETAFHHLLVKEKGRLVGVVSDRDLLRHISPFVDSQLGRDRDRATLRKRVHQIMTRQAISASPDTPVAEAARIMLDSKVSCLPIVNQDGKVLGIITSRDLLRCIVAGSAATLASSEPEPAIE